MIYGDTKFKLTPYTNYLYDLKDSHKDRTIKLDVESRDINRSVLDLGLDLSFEYKSLTISGGYSNMVEMIITLMLGQIYILKKVLNSTFFIFNNLTIKTSKIKLEKY